ncbi:branched-chain amino acid ABC transporter permease [Jiangella anatolica]|uniref:Branched-chain amino acid ABC transporter permease n=1 Tax=Jiangella anatolica TaxID=2670374 RepID=A0A2W2C5L2_9ACTN|nr:branched-chain amino acid ABC transporter permease [Jiangella anatolica]PZF83357.1 branched-chain amino acid ABC transporter permease [Jiangella anatolica]
MATTAVLRPQLRTSYRQERSALASRAGRTRLAVVAGLFLALPYLVGDYSLDLVNLVAVAAVASIGVNILTGYAGQLSVGHAAFAAVGAYGAVNLVGRAGLPLWAAVVVAALIAGCASLVFGLVAVRIRGLYLAIATLAAQFVIVWVLNHWEWVTGGTQVAASIPAERIGPIDTGTVQGRYYLIVGFLLICVVFAANLLRSRCGRAFVAIRDHSLAAAGSGISVFRYTLLAFFVSSCYAGLAGALFAVNAGAITPEFFPLSLSISYIAMIIIGGVGTIAGGIWGAAFVTLLPVFLRDGLPVLGIELTSELVANLQLVLFGAAILVFLVAEPGGLVQLARRLRDRVARWPYRTPAPDAYLLDGNERGSR